MSKSEFDLAWIVSLSCILGEIKLELDVLIVAINAQQASAREERKGCSEDIQNRTAATFIQSCWRQLLATKYNDVNLVITWSRNPHAKTSIPGKPSKSGLIGV
jgi:hypothetical protein